MKLGIGRFIGWQGGLLLAILLPVYCLSFADMSWLSGKVNLYLGNCNGEQKSGCVLSEVKKIVFNVDVIKQRVNGERCEIRNRLNWTCRHESEETNLEGQSPYYEFGFSQGVYSTGSGGMTVPDELSGGVVVTKTDWMKFRCGRIPFLLCAPIVGWF